MSASSGPFPDRKPVALPAGLSAMPPGPELAVALATVDVTQLSGHDTVVAMQAAHRQCCHERAVMLRAVLETGLREVGSADMVKRCAEPGEFAAEETRAALTLSRRAADDTYGFAWEIFCRLPMLGQVMLAGELDEPRARAMASWTADLTAAQAVRICRDLLPDAGSVTVGALTDRIKRAAIAIDPEWAERRYRSGLRERRIVGSMNPNGTADVSGRSLPADRAIAACDRVDDLAGACKRAGDGRAIDHIRADIYLGLLDGSYEALSHAEIVADMRRHAHETDATGARSDHPSDPEEGHDGDAGPSDFDGPSNGGVPPVGKPPGSGAPSAAPSSSSEPQSDDSLPGGGGASRGDDPTSSPEQEQAGPFGDGGPADDAGPVGETGQANTADGSGPVSNPNAASGRRAARELRLELLTAAGADDHPAEIPGWGVVPADVARGMLPAMTGGEWRFAICDHDGRPIASGITTARPWPRSGAPSKHAHRKRPIVELHIRETDLSASPGHHRPGHQSALRKGQVVVSEGWAAVLADIANRYQRGDVDLPDKSGRVTDAELRRRFARAGLRRHVEVRDRYCTHPSCRQPATQCDQDHAIDHACGGVTVHTNLDSSCRHDHRLQHDGGWKVVDPATSRARWISPLGLEYPSRPPPVMVDLPEPELLPAGETTLLADASAHVRSQPCGCPLADCRCSQATMPAGDRWTGTSNAAQGNVGHEAPRGNVTATREEAPF